MTSWRDYGPGFRRALSEVLGDRIDGGEVDVTSAAFLELFERAEPGTVVRALIDLAAQLAIRPDPTTSPASDRTVVQAKVAVDQTLEMMAHPPVQARPR